MNKSLRNYLKSLPSPEEQILRQAAIDHLPDTLQNYLHRCRVIGKPLAQTVWLSQQGRFHLKGKWVPMRAEQVFSIPQKAFIWKARTGLFRVTDEYIAGRGALRVRLGFIPLANSTGPEMDQGEILRFLTEMIWFPSAFASAYLSWKTMAPDVLEASISYGEQDAQAQFYFGENGDLEKITARRYREENGTFELGDWEIVGFAYREFDGIRVPYQADVRWQKETGPESYYQFSLTDLRINPQVK